MIAPNVVDRFMQNVEPEPNTGCWLWSGGESAHGYGCFSFGRAGRSKLAHRASYEMFIGEIPAGLHVCHSCDTPACVNPDHLWPGTDRDNVRDMMAKGRGGFTIKQTCKRGHPLVAGNLVKRTDDIRECLECHREHGRRYEQRRREREYPVQVDGRIGVITKTGSRVEIVTETPSSFWVRSRHRVRLAGNNRWLEPGFMALVPKRCITVLGQGA